MSLLNDLVGKKVIVCSVGAGVEKQDVGMLEAHDSQFVKLKKSETETLFFGVQSIRFIKTFEF